MTQNILILEGLPSDLDQVRPRVDLYFRNKRRSGGEIMEIKDYPGDTRKALLVYNEDGVWQNVLTKAKHQIDFKEPFGVIELQVKLKEDSKEVKKVKPPVLPRPDKSKLIKLGQSAPSTKKPEPDVTVEPATHEATSTEALSVLVGHGDDVTKEILQMYFEQFISEEVCLIKHHKNSWVLTLTDRPAVEKLLAMKDHLYGISVEPYEQRASGPLDPRRYLLSGFNDSSRCSLVSLYIGSCSQGAEHVWETLDDSDRIVVTFKQDIDGESFLRKCSAKKFQGLEIAASGLEQADSVLVQGDMNKISEETLCLYFSNKRSKGGEIASFIWVTEHKSFVITFTESHVAGRVVEHAHLLSGVPLTAQLFHSCLQKVLSGAPAVQPDIPTPVVMPVSSALLAFINNDEKRKQEIQAALEPVNASVSFNMASEPPQMELNMTMEKDSLGALRLGQAWERNARREAEAQLEKYKEVKLPAAMEVWERIESSCLGFNRPNASVSYDKHSSELLVVGSHAEVEGVMEKVEDMLKTAKDQLETERDTIETKLSLTSTEELDFIWDIISGKIPDVTLSKDGDCIYLKGLKDKVNTAALVVEDARMNVLAKQLDLSDHLVTFMMSLDLRKFERDHFGQTNISCVFLLDSESIKVLAEKGDIQKIEDRLHKVLKEEVIELTAEQTKETKTEHWRQFQTELTNDLETSRNNKDVSISQSQSTKINICGFSSVVADVVSKIRGYLDNKKPTTVDVPLKSLLEVEFVESCMGLSEDPDLKALGVTILACKNVGSPCLKITAASDKIKEAVDAVNLHLKTITTEKHVYKKAGESKVLEKYDVALKAKAKELKCKLHLSPFISPVVVLSQKTNYDINGSITLTVSQENVSQHASDALVCPLSGLAFDNPVAQQFLQSGGSEIKKVLDKCQKEKQTLQSGDVIVSGPGTLKTKVLLYAAVPAWGASAQHSTYLQAAVRESLVKADRSSCVSIGMPALGCGTFRCPVKDSCEALMRGILDFISSLQAAPQNLKNINIMETDPTLVGEFRSAIEALGYRQTTVPNTATTSTTTTVAPAPSSTSSPPPAKPMSKISVKIKMGDITKETVDVIVNSNNQALNLNSGVSGAILKAAGKDVMDECQKLGPLSPGGVVLSGGGGLKCAHIAQMVGPGNPLDITTSMEKVFQLCESKKAARVSIPAIGTGAGGIDPQLSLQAILKALNNHQSNTASSSIKQIFIVVFEQKVYDLMNNLLNKLNRRQQSAKKPTAASPPSKLPSHQVLIQSVRIEVRKGDITLEGVQGIVNTTNADLNLKRGVSGAILKAAGSAVNTECQNLKPLGGQVAEVTTGGDLQCDFILHMLGPHSAADATLRVTKVLERCEEYKISTVSFPAVGTGGGGLSAADSISAILQGIENHLSKLNSATVLKLIFLVVDQDKILQEFEKGIALWKSDQRDEDSDEDDSDEWSTSSDGEDDDIPNTIEAIVGPIKVQVLHGDITKEKTDVIVNSTNNTLNLNTGVSGAILKKAGQTVVDECDGLVSADQLNDGVVLTQAGNLHSKHIIHLMGITKESDVISSTFKALKMCQDNKIQSVSFPALGAGGANLGAVQVGQAMMTAIANYVQTFKKPSVTTIHIVIFQATMLKDFEEVMKQVKKVTPKPSVTKKILKLVKASASGATPSSTPIPTASTPHPPSTPTNAPLCLASAIAAVVFPTMEVQVCGLTSASLAQVKAHLDAFLSEECCSQDVSSRHFSLLLEHEKQAIVALSQKNQVQVLVAVPQDSLKVSGKKEDVLASVLKINDFLQTAKEREIRAEDESRLRKTVCWEAGDGEAWKELDSRISYDLELDFHRKRGVCTYTSQGETYNVDLNTMQLTHGKGTISRIKRSLRVDGDIAVIQPPPSWTKMDSKDLAIVDLLPASAEYQSVEKDFLKTSQNPNTPTQQNIQVVKIQRIQNKNQWQRYAVKKQGLEKKYPKNKNEQNLYHGTTQDICLKINTNGFNRSFCGRNATVYGNGTYFAREMWYSCQDTYSNPDANGLKYMYRARVLVGKPCLGKHGMKEPAPLNPQDPGSDLYDCAVDNLKTPFIYVVFCDAGAYPDYLISFKTS